MDYSDAGNSGWDNEDTELPSGFWDDLPRPLFWRLLVTPLKPREVTRGGIVLAQANQEAQDILNFMGKIVAAGPMAGKHERLGGDGVNTAAGFPQIGDYVAYGRFAGQRLIHRGIRLICLNDDEILAVIPNPETVQVSR